MLTPGDRLGFLLRANATVAKPAGATPAGGARTWSWIRCALSRPGAGVRPGPKPFRRGRGMARASGGEGRVRRGVRWWSTGTRRFRWSARATDADRRSRPSWKPPGHRSWRLSGVGGRRVRPGQGLWLRPDAAAQGLTRDGSGPVRPAASDTDQGPLRDRLPGVRSGGRHRRSVRACRQDGGPDSDPGGRSRLSPCWSQGPG